MLLNNLIKANKNISSTLVENDYFTVFYDDFTDIALGMFEWENLPESCDEEYLERILFDSGKACFVKDPDNGKIYSLKVSGEGQTNMYGKFNKYRVHSDSEIAYNKVVSKDDIIYIKNNVLEKATSDVILHNSMRLANLAMTIDININAQKTPIHLIADEDTKLAVENIYKQYDSGKPVIVTRKGAYVGEEKVIDVLKTDAPYVADKLLSLQHDIKNDVLTSLGVNNNDQDKKERLITSEVDANLDEIYYHAQSMLLARERACDEFNEKFNPDKPLKVSFRKTNNLDLYDLYMGGEDDSDLYNATTPDSGNEGV